MIRQWAAWARPDATRRVSPCAGSRLAAAAALVLLGLLAGAWSVSGTRAQDATPTPAGGQEPITFEMIGFAHRVAFPDAADLIALHIGMEPDEVTLVDPSDRYGAMLVVESGAFTVEMEDEWTATRAPELAAASATVEAGGMMSPMTESIAAGDEVTLRAGDAAYIPGNVGGEIRNDGQVRAEGLAFLIGPTMGMSEATPAA